MDATRTSDAPIVRRQALRPLELLRRLRDPSPPVAGLLLDLGGVLYDDTAWRRWLLKLVTRLGLHTQYTPFFRVWQREYLEQVKRGDMEYWQALRCFLRSSGLTHGQIDEVEAAGHARRRECETEVYPFPGVVHVLNRLRHLGVHLTLFSSTYLDGACVQQCVGALGLSSYFTNILAVTDIQRQNPSETGFPAVVKLTGISPLRLAYIGRDTAALAEAAEVGLRTVAVNYDEDAEADIYIGHVEQLLEALPWEPARAMVG